MKDTVKKAHENGNPIKIESVFVGKVTDRTKDYFKVETGSETLTCYYINKNVFVTIIDPLDSEEKQNV